MLLKLLSQKDSVIQQYNQGLNCAQIARNLAVYPQTVENLLKSLGVYNSYMPNQGNTRYFERMDSLLKAYFLGFITADGCLQSNGKSGSLGLTITTHTKDISILERLRQEIGCENKIQNIGGPMTHDKSMEKNHCRFQLFNKDLYNDLMSYGLTPRKSITMPNILPNIPLEYRRAFIVGYFDGDGSACFNSASNQMMISFRGTQAFLQGIAEELQPKTFWLSKDKQKTCWSLVLWRKGDVRLFYNNYKELDFYLERKYQRIRSFLKIDKEETIS